MEGKLQIKLELSDFCGRETIDQTTFNTFAGDKLLQKSKALKAFKIFDSHGKGVVVLEDLQRVAAELEEPVNVEELEEMIQEVDSRCDGMLTPEHFVKIASKVGL